MSFAPVISANAFAWDSSTMPVPRCRNQEAVGIFRTIALLLRSGDAISKPSHGLTRARLRIAKDIAHEQQSLCHHYDHQCPDDGYP